MKEMNLLKIAVAIALLFAVNMDANAQFGKLKSLAKKAKEAVTEKVETTTDVNTDVDVEGESTPASTSSTSSSSSYTYQLSPREQEAKDVKDAGGLQQYLGLTEGDGLLLWEYYQAVGKYTDYRHDNLGGMARNVVNLMRWTKNKEFEDAGGAINYAKFPERVDIEIGHVDASGKLVGAAAKKMLNTSGKGSVRNISAKDALPKSEHDALTRVTIKAIKAFEAKYGSLPLQK